MTLPIADGLDLPLDFATRKTSLLAKSGAGKSYALRKITESLVQVNRAIPGALIDPLGVMYGLRFGPDGVSAGLPIPIIGGAHGDVPIRASSGQAVAKALVHGDSIAILDVSQLDDEEQWEFVKGFASSVTRELMARKRAFWLGIDEADLFAPETPMKGQLECQRAVRHYCRRARNFGGGYTLATQSTSVIDKKVVGQSDLIIAMRVTSPTDQKPILEWLKAGVGEKKAEEIVKTLASFQTGEAWFYSPEWLGLVERHRILACETFDSSKTPEVGEVLETSGKGAAVNLDALRAHFESAIEEQTDDVPALQARVSELEAALRSRPAEERTIEVPVFQGGEIERLAASAADLDRLLAQFFEGTSRVEQAAAEIGRRLDAAQQTGSQRVQAAVEKMTVGSTSPRKVIPPPAGTPHVDGLEKGARGLLDVLVARHPMKMTRAQLATLSGRSIKSSSFGPHVRQLIDSGLAVESDGLLAASPEALASVGRSSAAPRTAQDISAMWLSKLPKGPARMLETLLRHPDRRFSRERLAVESGMSPTSSAIGANIKILRENGLIGFVGEGIQLSEALS